MKNEIKIVDESGDKKYFSQLPHYILNHSTAIDQALYWQMKRYSGESGKCFATQETLMKKLGIGRKAYNKSLDYLLKREWIKFVGMTGGKTRPIKTYSITDIWKLNILHYEKIPTERTVSFNEEIQAKREGDTGQKNSKIPAKRTVEEEPPKEEPLNKSKRATQSVATPSQESKNFFQNEEIQKKAIDYLTTKGFNQNYALSEIKKFISYWTEPTMSGKKQRWETEKTYDVRRRLATWLNNSNKFNRSSLQTKRGIEV